MGAKGTHYIVKSNSSQLGCQICIIMTPKLKLFPERNVSWDHLTFATDIVETLCTFCHCIGAHHHVTMGIRSPEVVVGVRCNTGPSFIFFQSYICKPL